MARGVDPMLLVGDLAWPSARFETPREGPSKLEQLFRRFEDHERQERRTLQAYRETVENVEHPMVKFVLNLIQLDEAKHCELVGAMLATLEKDLFWRDSRAALELFQGVGAEKEELLALVKGLVRLERDGLRAYKSLRSEAKERYAGLFSVLLRALIEDSEKHLNLLEFLQRYLKAAPA